MNCKILIPTDGSDYSKTAVAYGVHIGSRIGAELTGLHVIDVKLIQGPLFSDVAFYSGLPVYYEFLPRLEEALNKRAEIILDGFKKSCEEAGLKPVLKKQTGLIEDVILEEAKKADWVLLAQRGEHFHIARGGLLGSTAESVVRRSKKPVIITPAKFREIESMGLAYDGSDPAGRALKVAAEISAAARWPITTIVVTEDPAVAAELTKKVESFLEPYEIDSDVIVLKGHEDREIVRFIKEGAVELMVMGAYGRGRLKEFFLGSTTTHVIRNSPIPVLLTH